MSISGSVGRGGANKSADVRTVQSLLNFWRTSHGQALLKVDGIAGPKTIDAITAMQSQARTPADGRVDPNGPALKALLQFRKYAAAIFLEITTKPIIALTRQAISNPGPKLRSVSYTAISSQVDQIEQYAVNRGVAPVGAGDAKTLIGAFPGFAPATTVVVGKAVAELTVLLGRLGVLAGSSAIPIVLILITLLVLILLLLKSVVDEHADDFIRLAEGIRGKIRELKEAAEQVFRENIKQGNKCLDPFRRLMQLIEQFQRDIATTPADPTAKEQLVLRLSNLAKSIFDAFRDFMRCMGQM